MSLLRSVPRLARARFALSVVGRAKFIVWWFSVGNALQQIKTQIPIDDVHSDEESLRQQLKLHVDVDDPIHQDCSHILIDGSFTLHLTETLLVLFDVVGVGQALELSHLHVLLNFGTILTNVVNVTDRLLVNLRNIR